MGTALKGGPDGKMEGSLSFARPREGFRPYSNRTASMGDCIADRHRRHSAYLRSRSQMTPNTIRFKDRGSQHPRIVRQPGFEMLSLFNRAWETLAAEDNRECHQHGADADHREAGADAAHAGVAGEHAACSEEHRDGDDI